MTRATQGGKVRLGSHQIVDCVRPQSTALSDCITNPSWHGYCPFQSYFIIISVLFACSGISRSEFALECERERKASKVVRAFQAHLSSLRGIPAASGSPPALWKTTRKQNANFWTRSRLNMLHTSVSASVCSKAEPVPQNHAWNKS